ncbi:MAG: hypothetical protein ACR2PR_05075 [Pseudohongiellaceae bacterium]
MSRLSDQIQNVPKLVVATKPRAAKSFKQKTTHYFHYEAKGHDELPHVMKFSGGRSSGMLLFTLLKNGILNAKRGDVVIFNNTSAEHPKTYEFTKKCKEIVEKQYGIPFYWAEFQTYEDAKGGRWGRVPSYRLVKPVPWSPDEPDGYHWKGEVFEEMLSWSGYVPNQFQRVCTKQLKLETTRAFLMDWFACKDKIDRLGHHGDSSRITSDDAFASHQKHHGQVPREIFLRKKSYVHSRPLFRPEQYFKDFSCFTDIDNPVLEGKQYGNNAFFGRGGVEYIAFIGLRFDEMRRVIKVRRRNSEGPESDGYQGEHVYIPLAGMGVSREDINDFWDSQEWDLDLPKDSALSNCVYCFLKGVNNLEQVHQHMQSSDGELKNSPCDIGWWKRMEDSYGRNLVDEKREIRSKVKNNFIGFFGTQSGFSYDLLTKISGSKKISDFSNTVLPCDCTD